MWRNEPNEIHDIIENIVSMRSREFLVEAEKDEIKSSTDFAAGIACDDRLTAKEVEKLSARLETYPPIQSDKRVVNLKNARRSIADGRITPGESDDICTRIIHLVGDSASDIGIATFGNV